MSLQALINGHASPKRHPGSDPTLCRLLLYLFLSAFIGKKFLSNSEAFKRAQKQDKKSSFFTIFSDTLRDITEKLLGFNNP